MLASWAGGIQLFTINRTSPSVHKDYHQIPLMTNYVLMKRLGAGSYATAYKALKKVLVDTMDISDDFFVGILCIEIPQSYSCSKMH